MLDVFLLQDSVCQMMESGMNFSVSLNLTARTHSPSDARLVHVRQRLKRLWKVTVQPMVFVCVLLSGTTDLLHFPRRRVLLRQKQRIAVRP